MKSINIIIIFFLSSLFNCPRKNIYKKYARLILAIITVNMLANGTGSIFLQIPINPEMIIKEIIKLKINKIFL